MISAIEVIFSMASVLISQEAYGADASKYDASLKSTNQVLSLQAAEKLLAWNVEVASCKLLSPGVDSCRYT